MAQLLSIQNLSLTLDNQTILSNLNLSLEAGRFYGIVGPNGSGKSSLLNCIAGLHRHYQGSIQIQGTEVASLTPGALARRLACLHQHMPTGLSLSASQVVELGLIPSMVPWQTFSQIDHQMVDKALHQVEMYDLRHRAFDTLSGGEKQRLLIAQVIIQQPELLLLDEPTNHLDIGHQADIMSLVKSLGLTVLACIHDINLALSYCDQISCLERGQFRLSNQSPEQLDQSVLSEVFGVTCQLVTNPLTQAPIMMFDLEQRQ